MVYAIGNIRGWAYADAGSLGIGFAAVKRHIDSQQSSGVVGQEPSAGNSESSLLKSPFAEPSVENGTGTQAQMRAEANAQRSAFLSRQTSDFLQTMLLSNVFQQPNEPQVDAKINELEANIAFLEKQKEMQKEELPDLPRRGGHAGRNAGRRRADEIYRIDDRIGGQQASLQQEIDILSERPSPVDRNTSQRTPTAAQADIVSQLEERREVLENKPQRGGHDGRNQGRARAAEIEQIDQELARVAAGNRPVLDELVDNRTSRNFHADTAGISRELLDVTIQHEGGNFHSWWRGPFFPTVQEIHNDIHDVVNHSWPDTSVGYSQMQPANAVAIADDTFDVELSHEDARERLSSNDNFSNAIAAEFLARRADMIDPEHRSDRVIFTSYAASPQTVEQFNEIGWDFNAAEQLVADGELDRGTFDDLRDRYFVHYPNALD